MLWKSVLDQYVENDAILFFKTNYLFCRGHLFLVKVWLDACQTVDSGYLLGNKIEIQNKIRTEELLVFNMGTVWNACILKKRHLL